MKLAALWLLIVLVMCRGGDHSPKIARVHAPGVAQRGGALPDVQSRCPACFSLRAVVRGGAESDPPEHGGLSSVVASLLTRGTAARTAEQFASQMDFLGASLHASGPAMQYLGAGCPARQRPRRHAAFRRTRCCTRHSRRPKSTTRSRLPSRRSTRARTPRRKPSGSTSGRSSSLPLTPIGGRSGAMTAACGNYPGRRGRALPEHVRGTQPHPERRGTVSGIPASCTCWPARPKICPPGRGLSLGERVHADRFQPGRLLLVDKPDATQTQFIIGMPGIARHASGSRSAVAGQQRLRRQLHLSAQ